MGLTQTGRFRFSDSGLIPYIQNLSYVQKHISAEADMDIKLGPGTTHDTMFTS